MSYWTRTVPRRGGRPHDSVAFWKNGDRDALENYVGLPPGTRITIGDDPGYIERTKDDIDKDFESTKDASYKDEKPDKYRPPHWRAGYRQVRVVVETGEHRGLAGTIAREDLRPVKTE